MRPNLKLVPDFIIPNLERATYGRHLIWENKNKGCFKVSRIHQSSEHWSDECIAVYKAWSLMKNLWKPDDPKKVTKAKHRLITALRRNPIVEMLQTESTYYRFRLIKTNSLDNKTAKDVSSMEINVSIKKLDAETDNTVICSSTSSNVNKLDQREMFQVQPRKILSQPEIPIYINEESEFNEVFISIAPCETFPGMCNTFEESTKCNDICCCDILLDSTLLSNDRCIWHGVLS